MNTLVVKVICVYTLEALVAILFMSGIFLVYLEFLQSIFPSATRLTEMYNPVTLISKHNRPERDDRLFLVNNGDIQPLDKPQNLIATLAEKRNRVKHKKAEGFAWHEAGKGMALYDRDALQTLHHSGAVIAFDNDNTISMDENALVIIKKYEEDRILRDKRSTVLMLSGNLQGAMGGSKHYYTKISSPGGITTIKTGRRQKNAEYRIAVNNSRSSTVSMYRGKAEILRQGKTLVLEPNHAISLSKTGPAHEPVRLPDPVIAVAPPNRSTHYFNKKKPTVTFRWQAVKNSSGYRFVLAQDKTFRSIIAEKATTNNAYTYRQLPAGTFYWKVSANRGIHQGAFGNARTLKVVRDETPPRLTAQFPSEQISAELYTLTGSVKDADKLFVNGKSVSFDTNGAFKYKLGLKRGINVIVVEAIDKAGNVNYQSKIVKRN